MARKQEFSFPNSLDAVAVKCRAPPYNGGARVFCLSDDQAIEKDRDAIIEFIIIKSISVAGVTVDGVSVDAIEGIVIDVGVGNARVKNSPCRAGECLAIQITLVLIGWFRLQFPNIIYSSQGPISIYNGAAPAATLLFLLYALIVGSALIIPALAYLLRIFKTPLTLKIAHNDVVQG